MNVKKYIPSVNTFIAIAVIITMDKLIGLTDFVAVNARNVVFKGAPYLRA